MSTAEEHAETSPGLPPVVARLEKGQKTPICVLVVGMAGSGKSSLMAQMQYHANNKKQALTKKSEAEERGDDKEANNDSVTLPTYCINLDPATHHLVYEAAIGLQGCNHRVRGAGQTDFTQQVQHSLVHPIHVRIA